VLAALWMLEKVLLDSFVDSARAQRAGGLSHLVQLGNHWGMRLLVAFLASFAVLAIAQGRARLSPVLVAGRDVPIRSRWFLIHGASLAALAPLCHLLYAPDASRVPFALLLGLVLVLAAVLVASALIAMAPWRLWWREAAEFGKLWLYAAGTAIAAVSAWQLSQHLWHPTAAVTFALVRLTLLPVLPALSIDPSRLILGTDHFALQVTEACSGLEGVGFMLAFSSAWLLCCKADYRFPRALLLLPTALVLVFAFNVLRIAVLFLLGNAGLPTLEWYGFHAQAGWMSFVVTSCAIVYASRRIAWLRADPVQPASGGRKHNPTAAYVMPLLAILLAGGVLHALKPDSELLYPLQAAAGAAMLWFYGRRWASLDWRTSWRALLVGAVVFLIWIGYVRLAFTTVAMPGWLHQLSPGSRALWSTSRVLGAVVVVPFAEEAAYRGFLLRRLMSAEFESVRLRAVRWPALIGSAGIFGIAHGSLWLPGAIAGLAYGALAIRTNRIGEAVAAHATSNALIAATVLLAGQWQLWS
jgi:exosortase E/protease (VPEID-CTERM system)